MPRALLCMRPARRPTLSPYTTLFRSCADALGAAQPAALPEPSPSAAAAVAHAARLRRGGARHRALRLGRRREQERSEEHTSELQSPCNLVCRLLLEKQEFTIGHDSSS